MNRWISAAVTAALDQKEEVWPSAARKIVPAHTNQRKMRRWYNFAGIEYTGGSETEPAKIWQKKKKKKWK